MKSVQSPIYLAGPTASGKSAVAIELAKRLRGEIISVDSMQVYRGLNIGTAKPSDQEQAGVPHHLIDVVGLTEPFDTVKFVELARKVEGEIRSRERWPVYCGGTGLYFKVLFHGVSLAPSSDPTLRETLENKPLPELLEELAQLDPETHEKIDRENPRRVVRAVEAIRLSGRPFSQQQSDWADSNTEVPNLFALSRQPDDLRKRINLRVDRMFEDGLVAETEQLLARGLERNRTAMQAIGYRQVVEYLNGERSFPDTIDLIKNKTWQLARRQMTWLRNQLNPTWISVLVGSSASESAESIARQIEP